MRLGGVKHEEPLTGKLAMTLPRTIIHNMIFPVQTRLYTVASSTPLPDPLSAHA
jgi:hypothetical protein